MFIENDSFTVYGTEFPYCEFPKANFVMQRVPKPLPNVSSVSGYSAADNAALDEIAKEMGDEISSLYESVAMEEIPFWEDSETESFYVLAGMAGEIADKVRAENAARIADIIDSALYVLGADIVSAFGNGKNVLTRMHDSKNIELYSVESNLRKGIDEVTIIGLIRPSANGIVFNAAISDGEKGARFTPDIPYDSIDSFVSVMGDILPKRVNKLRDDSFRNGKGARTKPKHSGIKNKTADKAIMSILRDEDKAVIEAAKEFGYFPLPNFQGQDDLSEEDKKVRATMKKRNQRAKKKAIETMDAKRIEIMDMIDAISERQIALKPRAKANVSTAAIVPPKESEVESIKRRNKKAIENVEVFDHEKDMSELNKRLAAYATKAIAKNKAAKRKVSK